MSFTPFKVSWLAIILLALPSIVKATATDSLLTVLNQVLARKQSYDEQHWKRIQQLTARFNAYRADDSTKFELGLATYEEYKSFKYDSALAYCRRLTHLAQRLRDPDAVAVAKLKLTYTLLSAGLFKETLDVLSSIQAGHLAGSVKAEYYSLYYRLYNELGGFNDDKIFRRTYYIQALLYADSALRISKPGSYDYWAVQQFIAKRDNDLAKGLAAYQQLRQFPALTLHQLAIGANTMGNIYEGVGQADLAFDYTILAAIADVQASTKQTIAMYKVANYCYQRDDLTNAYTFIKAAQQEATFYKALHRQIQISKYASIIDERKIDIIEKQRKLLNTYVIVAVTLALLVAGFAIVILTQLRKLRKASRLITATVQELRESNAEQRQLNQELNKANTSLEAANVNLEVVNTKLVETNRIKEEYIGYYFHYSTQYLNERETLKRELDELLQAKQLPRLQKLVDGINIKRERGELLKGFDSVFLRLYPQFVEQFNSLFQPIDQVQLEDGQLLTPELRIFALIRLGIDDSEQIGQMLGYSINTIYAYKTRVKNRAAVPKEKFESYIISI